ncbi:MAG: thioredoxin [Cyanobium sp. NAT70]|nr:thioredoxin [Cyanobium sp. NAT70]|tara:strand:- start:624 stop:1190 length:567 start_codon:yes stop_codon:yes gene_type:complete
MKVWQSSAMAFLAQVLVCCSLALLLLVSPAFATRDTNSYDGNIYALYAGNGSLVPPASTLAESLDAGRTAVMVFYLDDSADCKRFAPVVSELQRIWARSIDLMPLTIDPLLGRSANGASDPATYWNGRIPQVVVIGPDGRVLLDQDGQVPLDKINAVVSEATGFPAPDDRAINPGGNFNEVNIEVTSD